MRRLISVSAGLLFACNPERVGESDTDSASTASTAESPGASSTGAPTPSTGEPTTTGAPATTMDEPAPEDDGLDGHIPCPQGNECEGCVQTAEWSVCGPICYEYGPGWAARCPMNAIQRSTLCPLDGATPNVCLIRCGDEAPCPDPGMLCVPCPEPFVAACAAFADWPDGGPNMCVWPNL